MESSDLITLYLIDFFEVAKEQPRVGAGQISLYMAILSLWAKSNYSVPFTVRRSELMKYAKLQSRQTFNKSVKDLHEIGFIKYYPPKNSRDGSAVYVRHI